jgi:hypothetical protein
MAIDELRAEILWFGVLDPNPWWVKLFARTDRVFPAWGTERGGFATLSPG